MFNKPQFQVRAAKEKLPKRMALLLLVAVGASLLVVLRPEAPLSPPLTGAAARLELEVRLDAQGNRLGRAAHWRLPDAGEQVASLSGSEGLAGTGGSRAIRGEYAAAGGGEPGAVSSRM